jgi:hypothetical protein
MAHHGHSVLRLPSYHPELNPIEKIWAQVKNYVATHNVTFKFEDMRKLAEEKFAIIGTSEWENVCRNAIKMEDEYLSRDKYLFFETTCLSVRVPERTTAAKARGFNRVVVGDFFTLLESLLDTL